VTESQDMDGRESGFSPRQEQNFFSRASIPALGPTQPPIQWVPGALSMGYSSRIVKLTLSPVVLLISVMPGAIGLPPLPHTSSRRDA
jgi:hypothetical protein